MIKKNSVITLRLEEAEKQQLIQEAEIAGLSLSELIRRRYYGKPVIPKIEYVLIDELRRQGGLLKHNFKALRDNGVSDKIVSDQQILLTQMSMLIDKISAHFNQ